jgi:hypothetical protein
MDDTQIYIFKRAYYFTPYNKRNEFGLSKHDIKTIEKLKKRIKQYTDLRDKLNLSGSFIRAAKCQTFINYCVDRLIKLQCVSLHDWKQLDRPRSYANRKPRFDCYSDSDILRKFKFRSKDDLIKLKMCFRVPDAVVLPCGHRFTGEEIIMISLYRLHFPSKLNDMQSEFVRDYSSLSRAFHWFIQFMVTNWLYLLTNNIEYWNEDIEYFCERIRYKLQCIIRKKNHNDNIFVTSLKEDAVNGFKIFAFIDSAPFRTTRPGGGPVHPGGEGAARHNSLEQRAFYSGYKKLHGVKLQTSTLPNGITLHCFPPVSVRHHDKTVLETSGLLQNLLEAQQNLESYENGIIFGIHGDSAYKGINHAAIYAGGLGEIRISEEFNYCGLKTLFSYSDYKHLLKLKKSPISQIIMVSLLLRNALICLNQTSEIGEYFQCRPPTLENYTSNGPSFVDHVPNNVENWVWIANDVDETVGMENEEDVDRNSDDDSESDFEDK